MKRSLTLIYFAASLQLCQPAGAQLQPNQGDLAFLQQRTESADFDGDGRPDIVLVDLVSGHFTVGFGEAAGGFDWRRPTPIPHPASGLPTGKRQHKPFTIMPPQNSGAAGVAFSSYSASRVTVFDGDRDRSRALRSSDEFLTPVGPLGVVAANVLETTPEFELIMPMLALSQPKTTALTPVAGAEQLTDLRNGAIDPAMAARLTDFAVLEPDTTSAGNGRPQLDHIGAYNFRVEIGGATGSQLDVRWLTGPASEARYTFMQPAHQTFSANMRGLRDPGQFIMWDIGLDELAIVTVSEGAGNAIALEELVIAHEGIDLVEQVGGLGGLERVAVVHGGGALLTVHAWDAVEKKVIVDQTLTPPVGTGDFASINRLGDGLFVVLDDGSYATYISDVAGDFRLAFQGDLPALPSLAPHATVMLYTDDPLSGKAFEFESFVSGQWARDAIYGGGQIDATREIFQSTSAGLGSSQAVMLTPAANPGAQAEAQANQFGDASSSLFFAGDVIKDGNAAVVISPPPGSYDAPVLVGFILADAATTVTYRVNGQPWQAAGAGGFFIAADSVIEFYGQSPGGALSAIQSAWFDIDLASGLDSNSDLLPDGVAVAFGLDPYGNGDTDGDGVSDPNEILNGSDPHSAASVPGDLIVEFPPSLEFDVLVMTPQSSGSTIDAPLSAATVKVSQPDGTTARANVPVANGNATVSNPSWYADFDSGQSAQIREFFSALVVETTMPALDGDPSEPRGASMFGVAFPPTFPLPQLPPEPAPGSQLPISYPTTADLQQWLDDTSAVLQGAFKNVEGLDPETESVEVNAETTLAVAAFTAWVQQEVEDRYQVKVRFPWASASGRDPISPAMIALLEDPQGEEPSAHELTHLVQQVHAEIMDNPAYLPLRVAAREMIFYDSNPLRPPIPGHIFYAGQALINFFETGEIDPFYASLVTPEVATLNSLRLQLLALPDAREVIDVTGNLVPQSDGTWSVESGGQEYHLFTRARILESVAGDAVQVGLQPYALGETELLSGVVNAEVRIVGFPIDGTDGVELFSITLVGVDLSAGINDGDLDGMDDGFESYFLAGLGSSFWDDSDGDGFADGEEYRRGTHPNDPNSFPLGAPAFPSDVWITFDGDEVVITWQGNPDATYQVQSGDLRQWQTSTRPPTQISPGSYEWRSALDAETRRLFRIRATIP